MTTAPHPATPRLAFRVGVTGKRPRSLEDRAQIEALRPRVKAVLELVRQHMHALADKVAAAQDGIPVYQNDDHPTVRLLSPLAEGADRIVAEEAGALGYELEVVLPFSQGGYETDFPDSVDQFRKILATAGERVLVLDGDTDAACERERSYQAAGRLVVRNSDLIIALWDGRPGRGAGGTADIVTYAARFGVPVWWISIAPGEPERLLTSLPELRRPTRAASAQAACAALREYIGQAVLPPVHPAPRRSGLVGFLVKQACRLAGHNPSPLQVYLHEHLRPRFWIWDVYGRFVTLFGGAASPPAALAPATSPVEAYWDEKFAAADALSNQHGARYRSSFVLVFLFSTLGFAASVTSLGFPQAGWLIAAVEVLAIGSIIALVSANHVYLWHERWITYRLLAELCRKQRVLARLARGLPGAAISALANDAVTSQDAPPREAWVAWYFAAAQRAAVHLQGTLSGPALHRAAQLACDILSEQIAYHRDRKRRCRAANENLAAIGGTFFFLTALLVAARLVHHLPPDIAIYIDFVGCILAVISAAFVGIRAYAEFDLLAEESDRMLRIMEAGQATIGALELDHPLASQDLGGELAAITGAMLQDVNGWAQLFRVKALETN